LITYEKPTHLHPPRVVEVVKLDGKVVGAIYITKDSNGYCYRAIGGKFGEVFEHLLDCRRSLIGE
jgi:hypothetical protein